MTKKELTQLVKIAYKMRCRVGDVINSNIKDIKDNIEDLQRAINEFDNFIDDLGE